MQMIEPNPTESHSAIKLWLKELFQQLGKGLYFFFFWSQGLMLDYVAKFLLSFYPTLVLGIGWTSFYSCAAASLRLLWVQGSEGDDDTIGFFDHVYFKFEMPCNYLGSFGQFENFWKFSQYFPSFWFIISCLNWCYSAAGRCKTWFYLLVFKLSSSIFKLSFSVFKLSFGR